MSALWVVIERGACTTHRQRGIKMPNTEQQVVPTRAMLQSLCKVEPAQVSTTSTAAAPTCALALTDTLQHSAPPRPHHSSVRRRADKMPNFTFNDPAIADIAKLAQKLDDAPTWVEEGNI